MWIRSDLDVTTTSAMLRREGLITTFETKSLELFTAESARPDGQTGSRLLKRIDDLTRNVRILLVSMIQLVNRADGSGVCKIHTWAIMIVSK